MNLICKFSDVLEKDMDFLFLEEIASSPDFLNIFISKVNIASAKVVEVEQSKVHSEFGESDMTVIIETKGKKHGLLIEDKIDAIAMPEQYDRYVIRGNIGIENGDYESFDVFIIAPEKYLEANKEAHKYPNQITYEECAKYFRGLSDARALFKLQQIEFAINKQKSSYQVIEHAAVTDFWNKYIAYQKEGYPHLWLSTSGGSKGSRASWPRYKVPIKSLYILHKSEFGCVDLTFPNCAERTVELKALLNEELGDISEQNLSVHITGKSAALRVVVPKLYFKTPFEDCVDDVETCLSEISRLCGIIEKLSADKILSFIEKTKG